MGAPLTPLDDVARQGAAALELANDYTDFIEAARRRKPTTPAAEIQQNLFPPRIVRIQGAQLAGGLLPSYEVGGDWFDFVDNSDGAWLAIAESAGTGPTAAGHTLEQALHAMHETVRHLGNPDFYVSALLARWRPATQTLTWVNCGQRFAYLADTDGALEELRSPQHPALGVGDDEPAFTLTERELHPGERLILVTDGITDRRTEGGGTFGVDGIRGTLADSDNATACSTAMAILQAVTDCWREPLEDDGTVVVLAID